MDATMVELFSGLKPRQFAKLAQLRLEGADPALKGRLGGSSSRTECCWKQPIGEPI